MQKKQTTNQNTDHNTEDDESFLSRWSRKKSDTDSGSVSSQCASTEEPNRNVNLDHETDRIQHYQERTGDKEIQIATIDESARSIETQNDQPLTDEDMPDINSLTENSDYSLFMSEGVSERLRKLALRKLFSGAGFNIKDGLDDYDDDFTSFEGLGDLITCDMKHQQEMKEKRELEEQQVKDIKNHENDQDTDDTVDADNTGVSEIDDPEQEASDDNLSDPKPIDETIAQSSAAEVDSEKSDVYNKT